MNNIFVYCEVTEERTIADVSLELLSKARKLANDLKCKVEAIVIGDKVENLEATLYPYGADIINYAEDVRLFPYTTLPHFAIVSGILKEKEAQICLFGATCVGRDLAPRVASLLRCGLTADCTSLEIGSHEDKKAGKVYENLLYQIRPAFGGNIIATIVNPETRPQMATVREGVMKKEVHDANHKGCLEKVDIAKYVRDEDFCVRVLAREIEEQKINIKNAQIVVIGGYGMAGGKDGFKLIHELADVLQGEVGATRAAVDAGLAEHERQVGQTGVTIRPKLCISCGVSGAVQHRAGMDQSAKIISINTDPNAPINSIADYTIIGDAFDVIPKLIKHYKANTK